MEDVQVLETIITNIVSVPEAVKIERTIDERGVLLVVNVDQADMGHLIGKKGATIQSIRTIMRIIGARNQSRINIKIPASEMGPVAPQASEDMPASTENSELDQKIDDLAS